jgi:hypothetical protein
MDRQATTLAIFTFFQTIYYPKPKEQRLSTLNKIILPLIALAVLAYGVVVKYSTSLQSLDWLYAVSYVKVNFRCFRSGRTWTFIRIVRLADLCA